MKLIYILGENIFCKLLSENIFRKLKIFGELSI